jgi:hypothetical protein
MLNSAHRSLRTESWTARQNNTQLTPAFAEFCPPNALALAKPGRLTVPVSAQTPAPIRCLRDITFLVMVDFSLMAVIAK